MLSPHVAVQAVARQVSADLGSEVVVLHLDRDVYYGLDEVGARIWRLLQSPTTRGRLVDAIVAEYDVERERCAQDVHALLTDLLSEGLVERRDATAP